MEVEARWKLALEGSDQGVWDCNLVVGTIYYSPVWRKMRGFDLLKEIDGDAEVWLALVHPDDQARLRETIRKQNSGKMPRNFFEYREQRRDGQWIWIQSGGEPVSWDKDGTPTRITRIIGIDLDNGLQGIGTAGGPECAAAQHDAGEFSRRHLHVQQGLCHDRRQSRPLRDHPAR